MYILKCFLIMNLEIVGKLVHVICQGDAENLLNETGGPKMERSESIASIESVEVDRPLDELVQITQSEERQIEIKPDEEMKEEPDEQVGEEIKTEVTEDMEAEEKSQEKMEVDNQPDAEAERDQEPEQVGKVFFSLNKELQENVIQGELIKGDSYIMDSIELFEP